MSAASFEQKFTALKAGGAESRRVASGEIERLYRAYWMPLCGYLKRTFGAGPPDPEDVAQTAFAKLAALDDLTQINNPRAFLFATARNVALDHKRSQSQYFEYARSVLSGHPDLNLDDLSPERVYLHKERFEIVNRTIAALPEKQRVVLHLHRGQGYTYQQVAEATGWSYGDVYRQMDAALATLMDALKR